MSAALQRCRKCGVEQPETEFYFRLGKRTKRCRDCVKPSIVAWQSRNQDKVKSYRTKSAEANRPAKRLADSKRKQKFPSKHAASTARYKALKRMACPRWANQFFINEAYELAALRSKILGFPWHVDHIVPIRSKIVCGLHVEHNLRVIPGIDNCRKNNIHWPGMP